MSRARSDSCRDTMRRRAKRSSTNRSSAFSSSSCKVRPANMSNYRISVMDMQRSLAAETRHSRFGRTSCESDAAFYLQRSIFVFTSPLWLRPHGMNRRVTRDCACRSSRPWTFPRLVGDHARDNSLRLTPSSSTGYTELMVRRGGPSMALPILSRAGRRRPYFVQFRHAMRLTRGRGQAERWNG